MPYPFGAGLTGTVAKSQKPLRVKDTHPGKILASGIKNMGLVTENIPYSDAKGHRSFLAAPLIARSRVLGVIRLAVKAADHGFEEFTHEDETFLQEIADRLGRILDERWLKEDADNKLRTLSMDADLRKKIENASERSLSALGNILATEFLNRPGINGTYLWAGCVGEQESLSAAAGIYKILLAECNRLTTPTERQVTINLWKQASDPALQDFRDDLKQVFREDAQKAVTASAVMPLPFRKSANYGFLWVCGTAGDFPTEKEIEDLAAQAAEAIEPGLTLEAAERSLRDKVHQLESVARMTREFASTKGVEELGEKIRKICLEKSKMDRGVIRLYDHENGDWVRLAPQDDADETELPKRVASSELLEVCLREKKLRFADDTAGEKLWTSYYESMPEGPRKEYLQKVRCWMGIPLQFEDRYMGIILLEAFEPKKMAEDLLDFLELVADAASLALRSALRLKDEQDLAQPFALIGSMMGGFLHVMRNCLNNLGPPLRLFHDPKLAFTDRDQLQAIVDREVSRMKDVVNGVALLAQRRGDAEPVDLAALVERCQADVAGDFRQALGRIVIDIDLHPGVVLRGNRSQLEIGIKMLIQNAIEAMSEKGGRLGLHARKGGKHVWVHVADSGPGMSSMTKANCLRPFFTTKQTGNGLGLPITLGIVRRQGGKLRVSSIEGRGSIFTMRFEGEAQHG